MALAATAVTFALVMLIAPVAGFAAGPGWIPWFFFIRAMRAKKIDADLLPGAVFEVVLDPNRPWVAVRTRGVGGVKEGWLGFEVKTPTQDVPEELRARFGEAFRLGAVQKGLGGPALIGLVVVAASAVTAGLAAVAIPSFRSYADASKAAEARMNLNVIYRGVAQYAMEERMGPGAVISFGELHPSIPRTPATPPCDRVLWPQDADPAWAPLGFRPQAPLRYPSASPRSPDGKSFSIRAIGDLDCDGRLSTFELRGGVEGGQVWREPEMQLVQQRE